MKFIIAVFLTALLAYTAYLFSDILPWWSIVIGSALIGFFIPQKGWQAWLSAFLGVFVCWLLLAWQIDSANKGLLASKMASILPLGGSAAAIKLLTAFVGGLVASFAALTGAYLRKRP